MAQAAPGPDSVPAYRKWVAAGGTLAVAGGSYALFVTAPNYKFRRHFHINKSGADWNGMDEMLHGNIAYNTARLLHGTLRWTGMPEKKATWMATGSSLALITVKEFLDGHHPDWGWSWSDIRANLAGTFLFSAQQLAWREQKLQVKISGVPKRYQDPEIEQQALFLFGTGFRRAFKDYNQQTYWLSANLHALGAQRLPLWLNLAVGTGVENLYGQRVNLQKDPGGRVVFDRRDLPRRRQWYLAPDIDLTKIPTRSSFLRTAFFVLNTFKFPLPALELTGGKIKFKGAAF